jgi:hypothetical protein
MLELDSAIQHLKESIADPTHKWGCEECKEEHEQLLGWLEDYKQLKTYYIDIDKQLRTANTENGELKRMLRLAVDDLDKSIKACENDMLCEICSYEVECNCVNYCFVDKNLRSWKHNDEAMELLGGTENAEN